MITHGLKNFSLPKTMIPYLLTFVYINTCLNEVHPLRGVGEKKIFL